MVLVGFNHKQVIIGSFKHCELTFATDGNEHRLIRCLKPCQPYAAGLHRLKGLFYVVLKESQNPSETFEGLTHTCFTKKIDGIRTTIINKINKRPPRISNPPPFPSSPKFELSVPGASLRICGRWD